jgi:hypothetical protein
MLKTWIVPKKKKVDRRRLGKKYIFFGHDVIPQQFCEAKLHATNNAKQTTRHDAIEA